MPKPNGSAASPPAISHAIALCAGLGRQRRFGQAPRGAPTPAAAARWRVFEAVRNRLDPTPARADIVGCDAAGGGAPGDEHRVCDWAEGQRNACAWVAPDPPAGSSGGIVGDRREGIPGGGGDVHRLPAGVKATRQEAGRLTPTGAPAEDGLAVRGKAGRRARPPGQSRRRPVPPCRRALSRSPCGRRP